jgi:tripartite ATP-independent transporter DctM subunit
LEIALPFIALVGLLLFGVPIAFGLAGAGTLGIFLVTGDWKIVMNTVGMVPYLTCSEYVLTTIPMFILMAYFSSWGGLARDLYTAMQNCLSNIRGGLGIATVFACGIFGAMSGASTASASAMSKIAMPEMKRFGYSDTLATGAIGVGSVLDILIPPSIAMVVYGISTDTSIGKLLIAGVLPGVLLGVFLIGCILVWVTVSPSSAPKVTRVPWSERFKSLLAIWPSLLIVLFVLVALYTGIATPTEVGAVGAAASGMVGVAMGRLSKSDILRALIDTLSTTAMILFIIVGAMIFGHFVTLSQIPQKIVSAITSLNLNRWAVLWLVIGTYFAVSMFMDELPLMLIIIPIVFPLITSIGFDPVWFGVMTMMMVGMGLVFPPVGMIAFVVSSTTKIDLMTVYHGTSILMIAIVLTTILLCLFPQIALWLPARMG